MPEPVMIQEILVVEQALEERIARVEAALSAEEDSLRAELAAGGLGYAEELQRETERRLRLIEQEAREDSAAEIRQAEAWCRRLDNCDDETLLRLLSPYLTRLLPGRGS